MNIRVLYKKKGDKHAALLFCGKKLMASGKPQKSRFKAIQDPTVMQMYHSLSKGES